MPPGSPFPEEQRVQLYGHTGSVKTRILTDAEGNLYVIDRHGMVIPRHDSQVVDEANPNNVTITYKLAGSTVATKTIVTSGTTTTITVT